MILNTHYPMLMRKAEPVSQWEYFWLEDMSGKAGNVVSLKKWADGAPTLTMEYSFDKVTWQTWGSTSTTPLTITLAANQRVYLRGNNNCFRVEGTNTWNSFHLSKSARCGGLATSLLNGSDEPMMDLTGYDYRLSRLFYDETSTTRLVDVSALQLPATTLSAYCYASMFQGDTSLVNAPALPATTLATYCYASMFNGCTALVNAPALPATTLAAYCYHAMFYGNTSLVNAPALPATTLATYCYQMMFQTSRNLREIHCLATSISATRATYYWVGVVSGSGNFYTGGADVPWTTGVNGIPSGWTRHDPDGSGTYGHDGAIAQAYIQLADEDTPRLMMWQTPFDVGTEIYFEPDENGDNELIYSGNAVALFDGCHNNVTLEDNVVTYKGEDVLDEEPEEPTIVEEEEQPLQTQGGLFGGGTIPNIIPQQGYDMDIIGETIIGFDENGEPIYFGG